MRLHLDDERAFPFAFKICLATIGVAFLSATASVAALFYFIERRNANEKGNLPALGTCAVPVPVCLRKCKGNESGRDGIEMQ